LIFGLYSNALTATIFFVSFLIITQIVLVNVVVAVLLDNFSAPTDEEPETPAKDIIEKMKADADEAATSTLTSESSMPLPPPVVKDATLSNAPIEKKMDAMMHLLQTLDARMQRIEQQQQQMMIPTVVAA